MHDFIHSEQAAPAGVVRARGGGSGTDQTAPAAMAALTVSAPAARDTSVLTLPLEVLGNGSPRDPVIVEAGLAVARTPLGTYAGGGRFRNANALHQSTTEQTEQYGLWQAARLGADPARMKVGQDWTDAVWQ